MKFLFRVDSSPRIGSGHFMRCLSFASYLQLQNHECVFACRHLLPQNKEQLGSHKIRLFSLLTPTSQKNCFSDEYSEWLGVSERDDFADLLASCSSEKFDALIVDHYGINFEWEKLASKIFPKLFIIDDLGRKHHGNYLLDMTLLCPESKYKDSTILDNQFLGSHFGILRPEFLKLRQHAFVRRQKKHPIKNIFCFMGGGQGNPQVLWTIQELSKSSFVKDKNVIVIANRKTDNFSQIEDICRQHRFKHFEHQECIASSFAEADIAIGAAGTTSYERACLGLPTLMIQTATNQTNNIEAFSKSQTALTLPFSEETEFRKEIHVQIKKLANEKELATLTKNSFTALSGIGFLKALKTAFDCQFFQLRPAHSADLETVYSWQNFPGARRFSRNPEAPSPEEHKNWFEEALSNSKRDLWILETFGTTLAFLRVDHCERPEVSILVNFAFWGSGLGSIALQSLRQEYPDIDLYAYISKENASSLKIFSNCGYSPIGNDWYINSIKN